MIGKVVRGTLLVASFICLVSSMRIMVINDWLFFIGLGAVLVAGLLRRRKGSRELLDTYAGHRIENGAPDG